ncbi:hypothetical protein A9Q91_00305 [Candidatus Gracilibacteria bacterium 28_42_T64]|nr:hypothetical protein A9Q91_00305 [Candidatus Gracilibacteria bacterium 28_42_T64]
MLKTSFYSLIGIFSSTSFVFAEATKDSILNGIIPTGNNVNKVVADIDSTADGLTVLDNIFAGAKDSIFGLMMILSIGVFLFLGVRLVVARGNPEEFKKAMMSMVYAVAGLFVVSAAWAAVKLVSGLNIS